MVTTNSRRFRVEPVETEDDVVRCYQCALEAFARQAQDGIWCAFNPGWDTPEGAARNARRLVGRWRASLADDKKDAQGRPYTVFLKATVLDGSEPQQGTIAGLAIWTQASFVPGHGIPPATDLRSAMDLDALYPGDEREQRFLVQVEAALHRRRVELLREKAGAAVGREGEGPPATATFVLDLCAVHPEFQRRGLARALVQWGLDEARRRGGIEAVTEASSMGRLVYTQLGFRQEGGEMEYPVDEEFAGRPMPSNVFLRTSPPS